MSANTYMCTNTHNCSIVLVTCKGIEYMCLGIYMKIHSVVIHNIVLNIPQHVNHSFNYFVIVEAQNKSVFKKTLFNEKCGGV